jgi:hypothetical protein
MKRYLATLLLFCAQAQAEPVKIGGDLKVEPYHLVELTAEGAASGAGLIWDVYPDDSPDIRQYGSKLVFVAPPGVYKVKLSVVTYDPKTMAISIATTRETVTIGTPTPPVPPMPPTPTDPLTSSLQAAYAKDTDTDKAASLAFLQNVYKGAAAQAMVRPETTNAGFVAWLKTAVEAPNVGLTPTQVKNLRTAIGAELQSAWGPTTAPLTAVQAATELNKIANALQGVK